MGDAGHSTQGDPAGSGTEQLCFRSVYSTIEFKVMCSLLLYYIVTIIGVILNSRYDVRYGHWQGCGIFHFRQFPHSTP